LKGAEIERQRIETLAEAEKQRLIAEADGHAASIRAQGEAEAEIIFKKGEAEARAMNVKAEAYQEYNQAAIYDKLLTSLPEVVRAMAAPLANVDKITVVSTGNGDSAVNDGTVASPCHAIRCACSARLARARGRSTDIQRDAA